MTVENIMLKSIGLLRIFISCDCGGFERTTKKLLVYQNFTLSPIAPVFPLNLEIRS